MPVTPQMPAGRRIEPPVSDPSAAVTHRALTAAPDPEDEPPVQWFRFQGVMTITEVGIMTRWILRKLGHVQTTKRDRARQCRRSMTVAVISGLKFARILEPQVDSFPFW